MNRPIKIGFLQPYSSLYPYFSEHLLTGFFLGMGSDPFRQNNIQFIPHFINSGQTSLSQEGIRKLVQFDRVDAMSGLVSYSNLPEMVPTLEKHNKLGFFFDLGEYLPHFDYLSSNTFFSSQQLWQSEFALGNWAAKHFGNQGALLMPHYEAGYHLHTSFQQGLAMAGGGSINLHLAKSPTNNPHDIDLESVIKSLESTTPHYVHALFSGPAGSEFLNRWSQSKLNGNVPLLVNENMCYDEWLDDVQNLNLELYTASMYEYADERKENEKFKKVWNSATGQPVNVFGLLGYELGLLFQELMPLMQKGEWDKVQALAQRESIVGPRGERNFYPDSGFSLPTIDIVKIKTGAIAPKKVIMEQGKGLRYDAEIFDTIRKALPSGWKNPYMCV